MRTRLPALIAFGAALAFGSAYYTQYFRWRGCFNEFGRCFDAETGVVYHEQSGTVWLSLALLALGACLYMLARRRG